MAGQMPAPLVGLEQDLVGDDVELLLRLALHVAGAGLAQHATERALADAIEIALHGARHHLDQQAQVGGDAAGALLPRSGSGSGRRQARDWTWRGRRGGMAHCPARRLRCKRGWARCMLGTVFPE
jgi:hypothetical protein